MSAITRFWHPNFYHRRMAMEMQADLRHQKLRHDVILFGILFGVALASYLIFTRKVVAVEIPIPTHIPVAIPVV